MELIPKLDCCFYVVNSLHLKRSLVLIRGENDNKIIIIFSVM